MKLEKQQLKQYYTITALERDQYEVLWSIKPHIDQAYV